MRLKWPESEEILNLALTSSKFISKEEQSGKYCVDGAKVNLQTELQLECTKVLES